MKSTLRFLGIPLLLLGLVLHADETLMGKGDKPKEIYGIELPAVLPKVNEKEIETFSKNSDNAELLAAYREVNDAKRQLVPDGDPKDAKVAKARARYEKAKKSLFSKAKKALRPAQHDIEKVEKPLARLKQRVEQAEARGDDKESLKLSQEVQKLQAEFDHAQKKADLIYYFLMKADDETNVAPDPMGDDSSEKDKKHNRNKKGKKSKKKK
ncbi:MAG: hypothetical protein IJJ26_03895 [Victivallales bacterium]|nr:hypothetical protein [Victivallales bacterium]